MRLIVTGCGRSGTTWMAHSLRAAGLSVLSERDRPVETPLPEPYVADVSWRLAPYTPWPNAYVVHLVRHPLDVIRSRVDRGNVDSPTVGALMRRWCPGMEAAVDEYEAAAWHWVQWNRLVVADEVLRLEDITLGILQRLAHQVDIDARLPELPEPIGMTRPCRRSADIEWDRVSHVPGLRAMAERFGYR